MPLEMEGSRILLYTEPAAHFCPERQNQIGKSSSMYRFCLVTEISRRPAYVPTLQCVKLWFYRNSFCRNQEMHDNEISILITLGICSHSGGWVKSSTLVLCTGCRCLQSTVHPQHRSKWLSPQAGSLWCRADCNAPCYWWWISAFLSAAFLKLCKTRRWGVYQDFVGTTAHWSRK